MKTKKIAAEVNGDHKSSLFNTLLKNYCSDYITELRKKQLKSYDFLAKSLAQLTLVELEKKMTEYTWLNDEDKHYIWKAISNEITAMVFKKRLEVGCSNGK